MPQTIQIKRSLNAAPPASLAEGELAYTFGGGGHELYIGAPGLTIEKIGGFRYTQQFDNVASGTIKGRVTAGAGPLEELTPAQVRALINVANGATANSTDAFLLNRANHTGTQLAATISDLAATVQAYTLDTFAAPVAAVNMGGQLLSGLADPVNAQDAATKKYVDAVSQGLDFKDSVRAATTANITLSGTQTVDGVALAAGDRVLVMNQTNGANNGIYVVATGAWTRATDADTSAKVTTGMITFVEEGTVNAGKQFVLNTPMPITLGTTSLTFVQFGGGQTYSAGNGIGLTGSTFFVAAGTGLTQDPNGLSISATYAGQTSITTVGTITTGTWNGAVIDVAHGGTGATSITGLVKGNGTGAMTAAIPDTDYLTPTSIIDGGTF